MYKITKQQHGSITDTFTIMETISLSPVTCQCFLPILSTIILYFLLLSFHLKHIIGVKQKLI